MVAPHPQSTSVPDAKRALRRAMLAARAGWDGAAAGRAIMQVVLDLCRPPPDAVVAGVWPLPNEVDLRPLMLALAERGQTLVLPETPPRGHPLVFRQWQPGTTMLPGRFGTEHPDGPVLVPDWLFVPLLAFDRVGRRLGYGGGYYDRTLAALPAHVSVGFGFATQQVDAVPTEGTDLPLDFVVTDAGLIRTHPTQER